MSQASPLAMRFAAVPDGAGGYRHELREVPAAAVAGKGRKKHVPDPIKANPEASAQMLKQYIERAERIGCEISDMQADQADVFAEAKSQGFSPKTMKTLMARRKKDREALQEEDALLEAYSDALGVA